MSGNIYIKFFVNDWEAEPSLRLCSFGAQGLWMRMLCIAAKHDPIGYVAVAGHGLDIPGLARLIGGDASEIAALLGELERNGVFSRDRKGRIYSRRMLRDARKAALARLNGRSNGKKPHGVSREGDRRNSPSVTHQKPESISQEQQRPNNITHIRAVAAATRPGVRDWFAEFWQAYPTRDGANPREPARKKFNSAVASGVEPAAIVAGARRYAAEARANAQERTRFVAQAVTWLTERRWEDYGADNGGASNLTDQDRERMFAELRGGSNAKPDGEAA